MGQIVVFDFFFAPPKFASLDLSQKSVAKMGANIYYKQTHQKTYNDDQYGPFFE